MPTLAFPGAEGFARHVSGGRGGDVYHVTNLNDSGEGSFRDAVESQNGPRTIVFDVAGTIDADSTITLKSENHNLTIAGQTAPGQGITYKGRLLIGIGSDSDGHADNVIVRYIRCRLHPTTSNIGPLRIHNATNIILDHVSCSYAVNETLATSAPNTVGGDETRPDNITYQWCLVTEGLYNPLDQINIRSAGVTLRAWHQTYHHCMTANCRWRHPYFGNEQAYEIDGYNNVAYNWGTISAYNAEMSTYNWVNNYHKPGPATAEDPDPHWTGNDRSRYIHLFRPESDDANVDQPSAYIEGNYMDNTAVGKYLWTQSEVDQINVDNWDHPFSWGGGILFGGSGDFDESQHRTETVHDFGYPRPSLTDAETAFQQVTAEVGCSKHRDDIDSRIINEAENGTATYGGDYGEELGIIDNADEAQGFPLLSDLGISAPTDSDGDGLPDWWKDEHDHLTVGDSSDGARIEDGEEYTNLELYLHWLTEDGHEVDGTGFDPDDDDPPPPVDTIPGRSHSPEHQLLESFVTKRKRK